MITSFFNKSKPIYFAFVFFVTLLAFIVARINKLSAGCDLMFILKELALLVVVFASMLLLNFIVNKNNLTNKSNFEIVLFAVFLLFITQATSYSNVLCSNFFMLLGLRRIVSLRGVKNTKKKLFDVGFWFAVAALFYFWSILFFALIPLSLVLYTDNNIRHWVIPFLGFACVFLLYSMVSIIWDHSFFDLLHFSSQISFDYTGYNSTSYLLATTLLFSFGIWSSFYILQNLKKKKKEIRIGLKIMVFTAVISFFIVVLVSNKNGSEFLFLFAPLSVIIANYIAIIKDYWFKELFLGVLLVAPFLLLLL